LDLLNNIPYDQQVAPGPPLNNASLQSHVGRGASLLATKKTLEMYRMNVKKTADPAIQYEFAVFMINTAVDAQPEDGIDAAELQTEAKHILQRLSDRTYPFASYYLADGYFSGLFNKGKPDYDRAFPLFASASRHGHAEASYRAALCYEFGWGTARSPQKAVQFYKTAASKNHPGAATRLGLASIRGDLGLVDRGSSAHYKDGVKWLKRAQESADRQYNAGPYELGLLHVRGDDRDIFRDHVYAAKLFTQSAELGHPEAAFVMGRAYELGELECPKDAALSVHFYNEAASRGHVEGMMALCAWYMVGAEPVLEKNEAEAYEWAKQAAQAGESLSLSLFFFFFFFFSVQH
jgi:TPR repeat protein